MIYNQNITHRPRATQKIFPAQTHFGYILIISLIVFPYIIMHISYNIPDPLSNKNLKENREGPPPRAGPPRKKNKIIRGISGQAADTPLTT